MNIPSTKRQEIGCSLLNTSFFFSLATFTFTDVSNMDRRRPLACESLEKGNSADMNFPYGGKISP